MNNKGKSVQIAPNIRLYKQKRSPFWWVNVRMDGRQKRSSTKIKIVDDKDGIDEGRDAALRISYDVEFKIKHGIDLSDTPTFSQIADKVVHSLNSRTNQLSVYDDYICVINKYLKPFFKQKAINKVGRHQIFKFYNWRLEKNNGEISKTQKTITNKAFNLIFNLACDLGYIKQYEIPQLPKIKAAPTNTKGHFDVAEINMIQKEFSNFIKGAKNLKTRETRKLLEQYVHFLLGTGARPGKEVISLTYGNLKRAKKGNKFIWTATITKGKVASRMGSRTITLSNRAVSALEGVIMMRSYFEGLTLCQVVDRHKSKVIFIADYRNTPPDFIKPFAQYLKYLEMSDRRYSLYSLRHTYITSRLLDDLIPRRFLAKHCGTSEEVIEKYYDHVKSLDYDDWIVQKEYSLPYGAVNLEEFFE